MSHSAVLKQLSSISDFKDEVEIRKSIKELHKYFKKLKVKHKKKAKEYQKIIEILEEITKSMI